MKTTILPFFVFIAIVLSLPLAAQENYIEVEGKAAQKVLGEKITYLVKLGSVNIYDDYDVAEQEDKDPIDYENAAKIEEQKTLAVLAENLGISIDDISQDKSLLGRGFDPTSSGSSYLITINDQQKEDFEQKIIIITDPKVEDWRIIKSDLSPQKEHLTKKALLKQALANAKDKAKYIAQLENKKLGSLMAVTENPTTGDIMSDIYGDSFKGVFQGMMGGMFGGEAGLIEVSVTVKVKYAIQ